MTTLLSPPELSRQLREDQTPELKRRRLAIALSLAGAGIAAAVTAYQTGLSSACPTSCRATSGTRKRSTRPITPTATCNSPMGR